MSIDWLLLAAPMAAGLLVLATHVPLGIEVLGRGIIFIDLAIAQVAGLGAILAERLDWQAPLAVQAAAAGAALAGALLLTWTERHWPDMQEALIGLLFVCAAAGGILLLTGNPHGGEHLQELLAGQLLWVGWPQLTPVAALYAAILGVWFAFGRRLGRAGFYVLFALTVTASVQLVGVLLVFTSLIAPAVALRRWRGGGRLLAAWALGAVGYAAGLLASALFDLPAGAAIVCLLSVGAFAVMALLSTRPAPA
jgi:zinc/manganese transport system permease protein